MTAEKFRRFGRRLSQASRTIRHWAHHPRTVRRKIARAHGSGCLGTLLDARRRQWQLVFLRRFKLGAGQSVGGGDGGAHHSTPHPRLACDCPFDRDHTCLHGAAVCRPTGKWPPIPSPADSCRRRDPRSSHRRVAAFQNRDRIFVAQQLPAQITPVLLPTRTNILRTDTSEPDFFNTNTPVPTPSIPSAEIPTRQPTVPLAIVIPTQQPPSNIPTITPFVPSTPVPQPPAPATLPPPLVTLPVSTPSFPPPPTSRLHIGNGPDPRARYCRFRSLSLTVI